MGYVRNKVTLERVLWEWQREKRIKCVIIVEDKFQNKRLLWRIANKQHNVKHYDSK